MPCQVEKDSEDKYTASYEPKTVGQHKILVTVADVQAPGSPFLVNALDLSAVRVNQLSDGIVAKEQQFSGILLIFLTYCIFSIHRKHQQSPLLDMHTVQGRINRKI